MSVLKLWELTWEELRDLDKATVLAVLPVGATEAHGPHLPLATDVIIAEQMAMSGARKLSARGFTAIVLSPIAYTPADFAAGFPGTVSVERRTLVASVIDIARSLARHAVPTLVVANAHLDPDNIDALHEVGEVCEREGILRYVFPDITRKPWALRLTDEFRSGACHAGRYEGSMVMAARPELVRADIQARLPANPSSLSNPIRPGHRTFEAAGGGPSLLWFSSRIDGRGGDPHPRHAGCHSGGCHRRGPRRVVIRAPVGAGELCNMSVEGKAVVITGGGRGIGAAVAREFAAGGASVVVVARTDREIAEVANGLRTEGHPAWAVRCDVTDTESVEAMASAAIAHMGQVDILVNNAGVATSAPLGRITLEDWNRTFAVNVTGTLLCTQAFVPGMVSRSWGRVVNVASVAGRYGGAYIATYAASKHAVLGFTRSVAAEVANAGVTVNAVCPGYVDSEMTRHTLENIAGKTGITVDEARAEILRRSGHGRLVRPEEVAHAVVSLCDERAGSTNGQAIVMDGGWLLA